MEYRRGLGDTDGLFGVGFDSCDDPLVGRVPDIVIFFSSELTSEQTGEKNEERVQTVRTEESEHNSSKRRNYATLNVVLL